MKKYIIIIAVLLSLVVISGCINSDMDNINNLIQQLNNNIVNGDLNYNAAVDDLNSHNYDDAAEKINIANENFNECKNKIAEIKQSYKKLNNSLYEDYIDLVGQEIDLKLNATINLKHALNNFQKGNNQTANKYVDYANNFMIDGIQIQKERDQLVSDNTDKFKTKT
ncbi:MAG: hypothetical protein LBR24_02195 [Methanobrevibacter sp.]|jgi:outer membrane murein-binding lipoprotein Lpp|nr:hypothetical protein [Methanobrevibacter sp.]